MNKTLILLGLFLSVIFFAGCKKQPECNNAMPSAAAISWTGYNPPTALHNYFGCNAEGIKKHLGDTVRLWGWVYYPDHGIGEPDPDPLNDSNWSAYTGFIYLVSNEDHHGWEESVYLTWDQAWRETHPDFCQSFEEYLDKKWYVVATLDCFKSGIQCCPLFPLYKVISIDTIKTDSQP